MDSEPDRRAMLKTVAEDVKACTDSPLYDYREANGYQPVIGEGDVDADIVLVGEAPGVQEARTGRPFVGSAGKILDGLLDSAGLNRDDVYITNVVKDRPPDNRDPTAEEIKAYAPFLRRQMQVLRPRVIVTLGRIAMRFFLRELNLDRSEARIGDLHGKMLEGVAAFGEVVLLPLYHPAALFYNRGLEQVMEEDFQTLKRFVT